MIDTRLVVEYYNKFCDVNGCANYGLIYIKNRGADDTFHQFPTAADSDYEASGIHLISAMQTGNPGDIYTNNTSVVSLNIFGDNNTKLFIPSSSNNYTYFIKDLGAAPSEYYGIGCIGGDYQSNDNCTGWKFIKSPIVSAAVFNSELYITTYNGHLVRIEKGKGTYNESWYDYGIFTTNGLRLEAGNNYLYMGGNNKLWQFSTTQLATTNAWRIYYDYNLNKTITDKTYTQLSSRSDIGNYTIVTNNTVDSIDGTPSIMNAYVTSILYNNADAQGPSLYFGSNNFIGKIYSANVYNPTNHIRDLYSSIPSTAHFEKLSVPSICINRECALKALFLTYSATNPGLLAMNDAFTASVQQFNIPDYGSNSSYWVGMSSQTLNISDFNGNTTETAIFNKGSGALVLKDDESSANVYDPTCVGSCGLVTETSSSSWAVLDNSGTASGMGMIIQACPLTTVTDSNWSQNY